MFLFSAYIFFYDKLFCILYEGYKYDEIFERVGVFLFCSDLLFSSLFKGIWGDKNMLLCTGFKNGHFCLKCKYSYYQEEYICAHVLVVM